MFVLFIISLVAAVGIFKPFIPNLKRWHFAVIAIVSLVIGGAMTPTDNAVKTASADPAQGNATSETKPASAPAANGKWQYSDDKDAMRGKTTHTAVVTSENQIDLEFPYGVVSGHLEVRKNQNGSIDTMFYVNKGQILCNNFSDKHVAIKFDDKPVQNFPCTGASDGSSETAFIGNEKKFLAELKTAKKTIVEAEFYQKGNQQFTFDTIGLEWQ